MTTDNILNTNKLENADATATENTFVLSRNPNKAMQEMMDTMNELREVYEQENKALNEADTKEFLNLLEKKISIARNYHAGAAQMLERKEEFKEADPDLRKKLLDMQEDFSNLTSDNLSALDRMQKSVRRLSDKIMKVARDAVKKDSVNYSATGSLTEGERSVSIGLNESA